jgi:predicted DNA-binding protein YlxM (UPF0122 family)
MSTTINICPNADKCPLFHGLLSGKEMFTEFYRSTYCYAEIEEREKCKRFTIRSIYGKCPPDLLPNSSLSTEEIAEKYNLQK